MSDTHKEAKSKGHCKHGDAHEHDGGEHRGTCCGHHHEHKHEHTHEHGGACCGHNHEHEGHSHSHSHSHGHGHSHGHCTAKEIPVPKHDAILLIAFGTSYAEGYKAIEETKKAYEARGDSVLVGFSSHKIYKKMKRLKRPVFSVDDVLEEAMKKGYKNIKVQSLHIAPAEEYIKINRLISRFLERNEKAFDSVIFGHALLESGEDMEKVAQIVVDTLPKNRQNDEPVIFMGHGNARGTGDLIFMATNTILQSIDPLLSIATLDGYLGFDKAVAKLEKLGAKKVWLAPFMFVSGEHIQVDMAGDSEYSWKGVLKSKGFEVEVSTVALGEIKEIQDIFIAHSDRAVDDILHGRNIGPRGHGHGHGHGHHHEHGHGHCCHKHV